MAVKRTDSTASRGLANFSSFAMLVFLSAAFVFETLMSETAINYVTAGFIMFVALFVMIITIRTSIKQHKLAFSSPFILLIFYTALMITGRWESEQYFIICLALVVLSCIYSGFYRTIAFITAENIIIAILFLRGTPIGGTGTHINVVLINWAVCFFCSLLLLALTRAATIYLSRAIEQQNSFMDLLETTENYVAMVDERNEIVYGSKTLAQLGNVDNPALIQGRPLIDIFPGRSLKLYASKLLKEKENYSDDWEFSLLGQKRYFKAVSHSLHAGSGGTLISLYDMTHLAERDEIAVMKDSMQIGLFFMDKNFVIQDHYSRFLEEMLSDNKLFGKLFTDVIADSVTENELSSIKDYFGMILERSYDQDMLDEINPLNELHYYNKSTGDQKVFQCAFATVERGRGEIFILVTMYDITQKVELQQRLAEEEAKRQEEMQAFFELVQVEPDVFGDFMADMEVEFDNIDMILKDDSLSTHDALVKVYQAIHSIKSNAVILGLSVFGGKVHNLESKIKSLREMKDVPFMEMLNLAVDIEKISNEREGFREIISKLQSHTGGSGNTSGTRQNVKVLTDSLQKTATRAAEDLGKKIILLTSDIDAEAINRGPRRVMKDVLMQLIRNSAVHGVEMPDVRLKKGKKEEGVIRLSIKMAEDQKTINIKFSDDGNGLDYKKIGERAIHKKLIKPEDAENRDALKKIIFSPGFSTAEREGVHGGRGIGLNLVRDRIKEVNGTLGMKSEDGKGVMFALAIPV